MADEQSPARKSVSRRRFLVLGANAGGVVVAGALMSSPASAAAKVSKETVNYQMVPNGPARCGSCSYFRPPASCDLVDGAISASGWCVLYRAKG